MDSKLSKHRRKRNTFTPGIFKGTHLQQQKLLRVNTLSLELKERAVR
jgi:hypothetical protein